MSEAARDVVPVNIEDELRKSYLDYAMSVIVGRALPDARDGLKPVHRRVLFVMQELNNTFNRPYMKSARVVGEVMGKYHPHGDSAIYETIVRMAQDFSMRYLLVDGQGNFGSMDGDNAAAMRYTEIRMQRLAGELLADLDKETVDFSPNYDETLQMPDVLPAAFPNLLVNGSDGIAVGMATKIPPHNLGEVLDACLALLDDDALTVDDLMQHVAGPDFPTGAIINGRAGIVQAYRTGRGRILVRARASVETDARSGRDVIIVNEIPYQLNKARLIEKIAELVKDKQVEGITELRDESDKDGVRIVIEVRRGDSGEVVLNNLYNQTQLQVVYGINAVALVDGRPRLLNLKDMLEIFLAHRREVVTRRTRFLLRKARERGHLLEGQTVALSNVDPVIELIKTSANAAEAKERLIAQGWASTNIEAMLERAGGDICRPDDLPDQYGLHDGLYWLSPDQAQSILELRLHRLTNMEQDKLRADYEEVLGEIADLREILDSRDRLLTVIREELTAVRERYADERRTEIVASQQDLTVEDLIEEEDRVVTISHAGYAKSQPLTEYEAQRRGGVGKSATGLKDEDFVEHLLVANSHSTVLCFSNRGKVYWLRVFQIPAASRSSRGRPMVNLLPLAADERITAFLPVSEYDENHFVFMATANGTVKKTPLDQFSRPRTAGLIALELDDDNTLVGAAVTDGSCDIMLFTSNGKAVRFKESDVRSMGRTARGVRGVRLLADARVISLIVPRDDHAVLTAASHGQGKRTPLSEYPQKGRGTQGVIGMRLPAGTALVSAVQVTERDELMLISDQGTLVRTRASEVSSLSRSAQGVRLINVRDGERLVGVARIEEQPAADRLPDGEAAAGPEPSSAGDDAAALEPPADD